MSETYIRNSSRAASFAERYIYRAIRIEVLDRFVRALCLRAGPGWPQIYTDHLVAALYNTPIGVAGGEQVLKGYHSSYSGVSIDFRLEGLGDYKDFERGAHFQALLAAGGDGGHKHHGMNPHPAKVELPYAGQALMNDSEKRAEFWEEVVVGGDLEYQIGLMKGKSHWTIGEHMAYLGYEVSPLNEIYLARTIAWGSKAPQWLLLENGSGGIFGATDPEIRPVDFLNSIDSVSKCIAERIFTSVFTTLVELAEEQGVRLGRTGIPYQVIEGRGASFAPYKEITEAELAANLSDYEICFGRI